MKKKGFSILILSFMSLFVVAQQKIGYVDTDYILKNIPAYQAAQAQLDKISADWQKEIENIYAQVDKMYRDFQAEKVLLTEEMKIKRENEIIAKEKEAKDLQKKYFGKDGELFKKRTELIKPIQDDVFNAIKDIAIQGNYALIFDVAGNSNMLYTDPKLDKSDEVLKKLGYKN
ncbi:MAG: OmpH family outer membrane protein [Bacteroidales bacterium]|nr:OmpH family outer membrane protein [Bacteroidales bacterium]